MPARSAQPGVQAVFPAGGPCAEGMTSGSLQKLSGQADL